MIRPIQRMLEPWDILAKLLTFMARLDPIDSLESDGLAGDLNCKELL